MLADELRCTIDRAKAEILWDMKRGVLPSPLKDMWEVNEYVDGNGYGGAFEDDAHDVHDVDFWNAVQYALDGWLRAGRLDGESTRAVYGPTYWER